MGLSAGLWSHQVSTHYTTTMSRQHCEKTKVQESKVVKNMFMCFYLCVKKIHEINLHSPCKVNTAFKSLLSHELFSTDLNSCFFSDVKLIADMFLYVRIGNCNIDDSVIVLVPLVSEAS